MLMIVVLVGILLAAFGVSAWMWFQVQLEAKRVEQGLAVPVADLSTMQSLPEATVDHRKILEQERLVYEDRLRELKEELKAVQAKVQMVESSSASHVGSLQGENEALRAKTAELQAALLAVDQGEAKIDHLIVENSAFRAQIAETSADVGRLKASAASFEQENQQLKKTSQEQADFQKLIQQAKEEYQHQLENVYKQMEDLRAENVKLQGLSEAGADADALKKAVDDLSAKVRELEMVHVILTEKNEYLQYELTKSRAQVVGLERVCENLSPLTVMGK